MKVLIISDMFPKEAAPSFGIFVLDQAEAINQKASVSVIVPTPFVPSMLLEKYPKWVSARYRRIRGIEVRSVRYLALPGGKFGPLNAILVMITIIPSVCFAARNISFDVIHAHLGFPSGLAGVFLRDLSGKALLITEHGTSLRRIKPWDRPWSERALAAYSLRKADRMVVVSRSVLRDTPKIDSSKVRVIPDGFDSRNFRPQDKAAARERLGLPAESRILLYVGNLVGLKGVDYLFQSLSLLRRTHPDLLLVLVGDGPEGPNLKHLARALGIEGSVIFAGQKNHDEVPYWMNASDLLVLPSITESFGTVIIEARACGKPVVASRVGGIPEIVGEGTGILVPPRDPKALAEGISSALMTPWDTAKLVSAAEEYRWDRIAEKLLELDSEAANEVKAATQK